MAGALIRTGALTGLSVVARGLSLLIVNKLLATTVSPGAYAVLGNFQNIYAVTTALATGAMTTGITKYTAEYFDAEARQHAIWRASIATALIVSVGLALVFLLAAEPISALLLGSSEYAVAVRILAPMLPLTAINLVLISILNGKKAVGSYVVASIASSLALLLLTLALVQPLNVAGAMIAVTGYQAATLPVTLWLMARQSWFSVAALVGRLEPGPLRRLSKFAFMAIVSLATAPVAQFFVRQHLIHDFGDHAAGLWEAVNRFSNMYMLVVITPLSVYYLPRISEIRSAMDLRREVLLGYRIILPIATMLAAITYVLREPIVRVLFAEEFIGMSDLMGWQAIGDILKIGSWLLGFILVARGMQIAFIATEVIFAATGVGLAILFTSSFGAIGAQMAYAMNFGIYWIVVAIILIPTFRSLPSERGIDDLPASN